MPYSDQRFLTAIDQIYCAAGTPDAWPKALDAIAQCLDCIGTVMMWQMHDGSMRTIVSPVLADAAIEYEQRGWQLDFVTQRGIEQHISYGRTTYTDRHLATEVEIATHPFYTQFRAKHGLGPFAASFVAPPQQKLNVVLSLQGAKGRPAFTDAELATFEILAKNVERALVLTVRLIDASIAQRTLSDALDQLACGVLLLDERANVMFSNRKSAEILGGDLSLEGKHLIVSGPQKYAVTQVIDAIISAPRASHVRNKNPIVVRDGIGSSFLLHVLPISASSFQDDHFASVRVLLLAIGHGELEPADPAMVRDYLGVTLGEARVASLIGSGRSLREVAGKLGISEETARTVLKRVYAKTSISKQSQLANLLTRLILRNGVDTV